jgi:ribulose-5-phosphate 4-epimerase/fuculose-1-phosphate aldolase
MLALIQKYINKLDLQGLADKDRAVLLALDAELYCNKPVSGDALKLSRVFELMNINGILFSEPAEPYKTLINEIIKYDSLCKEQGKIIPMDCETRTFFHDIPVIDDFSAEKIAEALSHRKSVIVKNHGIATYGTVTPEQAFVSFSSTCFSTFVKYFHDSLLYFEKCRADAIAPDAQYLSTFRRIIHNLQPSDLSYPHLFSTKPDNEDDVIRMIAEAGRAVVNHGLVDSYFGNISYVFEEKIYISQTGSSMDELEGCIDAVPLNGSSSVGITASSELSAHKRIYEETGCNAILHGHPKFSVIMSMHCKEDGCDRSLCHKSCKIRRHIAGVPVVSGEIGTGPTGLMNTVAAAMKEGKCAVVYGHGVFTAGNDNFAEPFKMLMDTESRCRQEYMGIVNNLTLF